MPPKVLAKKMKVNHSTVINWRKGSRTSVDNVERLAKILDCDPGVLTSKRDPRVSKASANGASDLSKIQEHIQKGRIMCGLALDKNRDQGVGGKLGRLISFFNQVDEIISD
jgi:transcriptional regulator with XRE-family HTH domain